METRMFTREGRDRLLPSDVIRLLQWGNHRFVTVKEVTKKDYRKQIELTASGQFPCAVVLGSIDSRVPAEMIFNQGIGDIFNHGKQYKIHAII